ncbi:MAG: SDR family NAD(P)-dependent oxidoreductase, partial [Pseudomonadota bacterium]
MTAFQDKVVIVTGGARGLGRAYAQSLAQEGARVVVGDLRDTAETVAAIKDAGGEALGVALDVADTASCEAIVAAAIDAYGRLDGLVNNAALYGGLNNGRFETLDEDEWHRVMNVNVAGIWRCCKAAIGPMKAAGGGSIVNITSLAAVYGLPYSLHYA